MSKRTKNNLDKNQRKRPCHWKKIQSQRLLNFIICNKNKIFTKTIANETFEELENCIETKNFTQCYDKINYLKSMYKSYEKIIQAVNVKAKLSEDEIKEKQERAKHVRATELEHVFKKVKQIVSLKERALKIFEANFNPYQIMIEKRKPSINSYEEYLKKLTEVQNFQKEEKVVTLKVFPIQKNPLEQTAHDIDPDEKVSRISKIVYVNKEQLQDSESKQNEGSIFLKPSHGWDQIDKLRYIVFLQRYKDSFHRNGNLNRALKIYIKMSNFIFKKSRTTCLLFHRQQLRKFKTVNNIIRSMKSELFTTEELVNQEMSRMEDFIEKDFQKQLNSFYKKVYELRNSNQDLKPFVSIIKKNMEKHFQAKDIRKNNKKDNFPQNPIILQSQEQAYEQYNKVILIKIPFKVEIQFQREENSFPKQNFNLDMQKSNPTHQWSHQIEQDMRKKTCKKKYFSDQFCLGQQTQKILLGEQENHKEQSDLESSQQSRELPRNQIESQEIHKASKKELKDKRKIQHWTISQKIKFIAFIAVNKDLFIPKNILETNEEHLMITRLAEYIGTKKTEKQCFIRFVTLKGYYQNDVVKMITSQSQKLGITSILVSMFEVDHSKTMCFETNIGNSVLKLEIYPRKCIIKSTDIENEIEQIIKHRLLIKPMMILRHEDFKLQSEEGVQMTERIEKENDVDQVINVNQERGINDSFEGDFDNSKQGNFIEVKMKIGVQAEVYDELDKNKRHSTKQSLVLRNIRLFQPLLLEIQK